MNKYSLITILVLLILLGGVGSFSLSLIEERNRLRNNQSSLLSDMEVLKTENGKYKTEIDGIILTKKEFKKHFDKLNNDLENLNIKLNKVISISNSSSHTVTEINTFIKDSTIINSKMDTIKIGVIDYKDKWLRFYGMTIEDSLQVTIESIDSIIQIVYDNRNWFRRNIVFWKPPILKQVVSSANPNCIIKYSEYIEIKKR